jgi:hypothetical protein
MHGSFSEQKWLKIYHLDLMFVTVAPEVSSASNNTGINS